MNDAAKAVVVKLQDQIIYPLMLLLFAAGFLVFLWGVIQFLLGLSELSKGLSKEDGKKHMLWGLVGMFIMAAAYTLVTIIKSTANGLLGGSSPY